MSDIFNSLAAAIIDILPKGKPFERVTLKIKRLDGNVGFQGFYTDCESSRQSLNIWEFHFDTLLIHELYKTTTTQVPKHANWTEQSLLYILKENSIWNTSGTRSSRMK